MITYKRLIKSNDFRDLMPQLEPLMKQFFLKNKEGGLSHKALIEMAVMMEAVPEIGVFAAFDDGKLVGYCFAQVVQNEQARECFIWEACMPNTKDINNAVEIVKLWAQEMKCQSLYFVTRRNEAAYLKLLSRNKFMKKCSVLYTPLEDLNGPR